MSTPKVMHKIRLENKSEQPFTTAPALIVRDDRVLGQGMMTYTAKGGATDLNITSAPDIQVRKTDNETKRTPNAVNWDGNSYARIDLAGTLTVTNYRAKPLDLEIVRHVLGNITEAERDGKIEMVNVFEDSSFAPAGGAGSQPYWWNWGSWPYWWSRLNGVGRITWKLTLEPGKTESLKYSVALPVALKWDTKQQLTCDCDGRGPDAGGTGPGCRRGAVWRGARRGRGGRGARSATSHSEQGARGAMPGACLRDESQGLPSRGSQKLECLPKGSQEAHVPRSRIHAVVTDVHFWIPVVVLVLGAMLLLVLR